MPFSSGSTSATFATWVELPIGSRLAVTRFCPMARYRPSRAPLPSRAAANRKVYGRPGFRPTTSYATTPRLVTLPTAPEPEI